MTCGKKHAAGEACGNPCAREMSYDDHCADPCAPSWYHVIRDHGKVIGIVAFGAEFLGSIILAFIAVGISLTIAQDRALNADPVYQDQISFWANFAVPFWHAVGLFIAVAFFGHLSAHLNPTVTILFMLTKRVKLMRGLMTILASLLGWIAGVAILRIAFSDLNLEAARPRIGLGVGIIAAFFMEFFGTAFLHIAALRFDGKPDQGWALGLTLGGCMVPALRFSGAAFNTWRWFAPALIALSFTSDDWLWPVAHLGGMFLAYVYDVLFFDRNGGKGAGYHAKQKHCNMPMQRMDC